MEETKRQRAKLKPIYTFDCETDPFLHGRVPKPFLWGLYDGTTYQDFRSTDEFVRCIRGIDAIFYAHNGGKFDFHFLLDWMERGPIAIVGGRIIEIKIGVATLRDSYPLIPEPLAAYQKTKIDYEIFESEARTMPKNDKAIREYLRDDCVYLYELVRGFTEKAGRKLTLASNALAFSKSMEIDPGRTNKQFDKVFRDFYAGGRCQAFKTGTFRNVKMFDIKSAYPYAMIFDHPTGEAYRVTDQIFTDEKRTQRAFFKIEANADSCFWLRDKSGLYFPARTERNVYFVTGWELVEAIRYGLVDGNAKIICAYEFYQTINFKAYVDHWFKVKEDADKAGDTLMRLLAKKMLNALYGKLAQNPENFFEYEINEPHTEPKPGWQIAAESETWELHARSKEDINREKFKDGYENYNQFFNVATAASITGFVRALLLRGMHDAGSRHVVYCDTDSLFIEEAGNDIGKYPAKLGDFGSDGTARILHVAGKKLYAARLKDFPKDKPEKEFKIASKGVRLTFKEIEKIVRGGEVEFCNPAPTFSIGKKTEFVVRKIRATAHQTDQKRKAKAK